MANKVLKAQVTIDEFQASIMDSDQLKDYVKRNLFAIMTDSIMNEMTIKNTKSPTADTSTFTGTLEIGSGYGGTVTAVSNSSIGSSYNGTHAIARQPDELRVVEFTKNGKVTKVELQARTSDGWRRVPRIQIEDTSNV